jgi:CHAD domain-containing protein
MDAELMRRAGRMPLAEPAIGAAHATLARRQAAARRRLIKTLDRVRLERSNQLRLRHRRDWWHPFDQTMATGWAAVLRSRIARRAETLSRAMDRAGGVYFPNRLHKVRVAVKKLRYCAELAGAGGLLQCEEAVVELKRAQETLGRMRDAEVLLKEMDTLTENAEVGERELTMVKDDLTGEVAARHAKYLSQRERLRAARQACLDAADRQLTRRRPIMPVLALSAAATLPAGLFVLGTRER